MTGIDPRTLGAKHEFVLQQWGLTYRYEPNLPAKTVRHDPASQVRHGNPTKSEKVARFQTQKEAGTIFNPIVVAETDRPSIYILVDGNNRFEADRKLGRTAVPAYIVEPLDSDQRKLLGGALNQTEGDTLTPEEVAESVETAIALKMSDATIALLVGRSRAQVNRLRNQTKFLSRIRSADRLTLHGKQRRGPEAADLIADETASRRFLPKKYWIKLNQIHLDPVMIMATSLAYDVALKDEDIDKVVEVANGERTQQGAIEAVRKLIDSLKPRGPGHPKVPTTSTRRGMDPISDVYNGVNRIRKFMGAEEELLDRRHDDRIEHYEQARDVLDKIVKLWRDASAE